MFQDLKTKKKEVLQEIEKKKWIKILQIKKYKQHYTEGLIGKHQLQEQKIHT